MSSEEKRLEQEATRILRKDAREHHTTLRKEGILDERTQREIHRREIPFSSLERKP